MGAWQPYDPMSSATIETNYKGGTKKFTIYTHGTAYTIDLNKMEQARADNPARTRAIRRVPWY